MAVRTRIAPCLWFDNEAEEAARFYIGIFPNSRLVKIIRYGKAGVDIHQRQEGAVMTVDFELDGQLFTVLNGGPHFTFSEAISFQVFCDTQAEIDYYWEKLSEGGTVQQCGWLKDRFGASWQVVPSQMDFMFSNTTSAASERAMQAMLTMKKLDIDALERACAGR